MVRPQQCCPPPLNNHVSLNKLYVLVLRKVKNWSHVHDQQQYLITSRGSPCYTCLPCLVDGRLLSYSWVTVLTADWQEVSVTCVQEVCCVEFHPVHQILASGSRDFSIKFYEYSKPSVKKAYKSIQVLPALSYIVHVVRQICQASGRNRVLAAGKRSTLPEPPSSAHCQKVCMAKVSQHDKVEDTTVKMSSPYT